LSEADEVEEDQEGGAIGRTGRGIRVSL
jgi:hypothetical protein